MQKSYDQNGQLKVHFLVLLIQCFGFFVSNFLLVNFFAASYTAYTA